MTVCTSGLGRVRRAGECWPGSRSSSSPVSGSQQGISLFSNTACSMLLSLLLATHCSKCDTSHHLLTKTRSGVSSQKEQGMLCHLTKPSPRGQMGDTRPKPQTHQTSAGPRVPAVHTSTQKHALPCTHTWVDSQVTPPGAEEDFKLQPPFLISLPHCEATGTPSQPSLSIFFPPALCISIRAG